MQKIIVIEKREFLQNIEDVIESKGYYVATFLPGPQPGYVYSIGLTESMGFEYVFAVEAISAEMILN